MRVNQSSGLFIPDCFSELGRECADVFEVFSETFFFETRKSVSGKTLSVTTWNLDHACGTVEEHGFSRPAGPTSNYYFRALAPTMDSFKRIFFVDSICAKVWPHGRKPCSSTVPHA
jgi:hypothetical protein